MKTAACEDAPHPVIRQGRASALVGLVVCVVASGCAGDTATAPGGSPPSIVSVDLQPNPHNHLSTVAHVTLTNGDSARLRYWSEDDVEEATPYYRVTGDEAIIAAVGLRANTAYQHVVDVKNLAGTVQSAVTSYAVGALPASLEQIHLDLTGAPSPGYTLLTEYQRDTMTYALAFDDEGQIRWYRGFGGVTGQETKQQPNGNFTVFLGFTFGWQPTYGRFVEFTPAGEIVGEHAASAPFYTDNHELLMTMTPAGDTRLHLFGYDIRRVDLTGRGGLPDVALAGHQILRQTPAGSVEFSWNAWDHLEVDDWIEPVGDVTTLESFDFDHPNSLAIDADGNYVVSFRNLGEVAKIGSRHGTILWRLGGRNNQFSFVDDPFGGFSAQHAARMLPNGNLLLFDNGVRHVPPESRAVEYALDFQTMTATVVWQYRHTPPLFTPIVGFVERYDNGNTLVAFGTAGVVVEATSSGEVVWQGQYTVDGSPGDFYRARKVLSLYEYRDP